jgi:hypothetical protein
MVEYALIIAHDALSVIPNDLLSRVSQLHWSSLGYAALALVALCVAWWAFRPNH